MFFSLEMMSTLITTFFPPKPHHGIPEKKTFTHLSNEETTVV